MTNRTIGVLAKEVGISVEAVRYYERLGLIEKPRTSGRSKWRIYEDRSMWALRYVKLAQDFGFSLAEIADLLLGAQEPPPVFCRNLRARVSNKLVEVEREIAALQSRRQAIMEYLAGCAARDGRPECPIFKHLANGA
jgi:MerR family copper efflux transcriptional regulator